jgi:hypothetical protein
MNARERRSNKRRKQALDKLAEAAALPGDEGAQETRVQQAVMETAAKVEQRRRERGKEGPHVGSVWYGVDELWGEVGILDSRLEGFKADYPQLYRETAGRDKRIDRCPTPGPSGERGGRDRAHQAQSRARKAIAQRKKWIAQIESRVVGLEGIETEIGSLRAEAADLELRLDGFEASNPSHYQRVVGRVSRIEAISDPGSGRQKKGKTYLKLAVAQARAVVAQRREFIAQIEQSVEEDPGVGAGVSWKIYRSGAS